MKVLKKTLLIVQVFLLFAHSAFCQTKPQLCDLLQIAVENPKLDSDLNINVQDISRSVFVIINNEEQLINTDCLDKLGVNFKYLPNYKGDFHEKNTYMIGITRSKPNTYRVNINSKLLGVVYLMYYKWDHNKWCFVSGTKGEM